MSTNEQVLEIRLDDGRVIVARPRSEDQPYLEEAGRQTTITLGKTDFDTAGHGISDEIEVDVSGHAMTLRMPTPADAEALRRLLVAGALTATIVAAGSIAALQPAPASVPQTVDTVTQPFAAPAPAPDFADRRGVAIDEMLEAPPAVAPADNLTIDRGEHGGAANLGGANAAQSQVAPAVRPGSPSADFADRREDATDKLLEAPGGDMPSAPDSGIHRGGPQD